MFGTSSRMPCRTKGRKLGSIRKENENNILDGVSVDQLRLYHTLLVPQLSGKLTSARIWDAQLMVDHFSGLNYVNLMRSTNQDHTLA